jgi:hypothetical protein
LIGEFEADPATGRWTFTARLPRDGPHVQQVVVAAELDDGTMIRGRARVAFTPEEPGVWLLEGVDRFEEG